VTWTDSRETIGGLKLASVGFVGIPAQEMKTNSTPKMKAISNAVFLFIIEPPSIRKDQFSLQNDQCKVSSFIIGIVIASIAKQSVMMRLLCHYRSSQ
jgi:hypothetical protein